MWVIWNDHFSTAGLSHFTDSGQFYQVLIFAGDMIRSIVYRLIAGSFFIFAITAVYICAYLPDKGYFESLGLKTIEVESPDMSAIAGVDTLDLMVPTISVPDSLLSRDSISGLDTILAQLNTELNVDMGSSDSTKQFKIALIGDSQAGGLIRFLNNYCQENNYRFSFAVVWYSASIFNYAYADTVQKILNKFKPDFLLVSLGLNELWARDLERRKSAAIKFLKKIEHIPYCFIGPANYMEDKGINDVYANCVGDGKFFLSKDLNLPKGGDGRHPSTEGYKIWMDTIAKWMYTESVYHIKMVPPSQKYSLQKIKRINLNAAKYKGY